MKRLACLAIVLLCVSNQWGCARVRVIRSSAHQPSEPRVSRTRVQFLWGTVGFQSPGVLNQDCPEGWEEITTYKSWLYAIIQGVTLGIVTPWKEEVACSVPVPKPKGPA